MQLLLANHDQSKSWVPSNASAFGTKKLVSWINRCLLVLSDYLVHFHTISCFKRKRKEKKKVKTRLLDQYCSSVVSFLIKPNNQVIKIGVFKA